MAARLRFLVPALLAATAFAVPAANAGLKSYNRRNQDLGDVIVAVNGRPIESLPTLGAELDRVGVGEFADLTVVRDGKERRVKVRVVDANR